MVERSGRAVMAWHAMPWQVHSMVEKGASGLIAAGEELLTPKTEDVRLDLFMADRLHPNAEGHRLLAACLEEALTSFGAMR